MTAFTGAPYVKVNGTTYSNWIDYNINLTGGYYDIDATFQPGTATVTLIGSSNLGFNPDLNDIIEIGDSALMGAMFTGKLTDMTISMANYGSIGDIVTASLTIMGASFDLQNATWVLSADTTDTGQNLIDLIMAQVGQTQWFEVNPSLTWAAVDPSLTWGTFSDVNSTLINGYSSAPASFTTWPTMKLTAGTRNAWDDLNAICAGAGGYIHEGADGKLYFSNRPASPIGRGATMTADMIDPYITATKSLTDLRNSISVANETGTTPVIYRDDDSVYLYGEQTGAITTYLTNSGDVATIGTLLLDRRSTPKLRIQQLSFDLQNPNITDAVRGNLFGKTTPKYTWITTGIPTVYGGDVNRIAIGYNANITKDGWFITFNIIDESEFYSHKTWSQFSKLFTWASYGVANPTTKWSDL